MKKRVTPHHLHSFRIILCGVLLIAVAMVRVDAAHLPKLTQSSSGVLAYATSISRADLLIEANASRSANGLAPLTINSQLNSSAQAKAQHMLDNNYWAHVAPDGTQPWYFFEAAGYSYSAAGENLAYGFSSSYATNQGWMNSEGHRANILGDYTDVGFGFVNAPNFQGGENTIVVAHYGKPLAYTAPAPAASSTPAAPAPAASSTPTPAAAQATPAPATSTPTTTPTETPASPTAKQDTATPNATATTAPAAVAVGTAKNVSILDTLRFGSLSSTAIMSLALTSATVVGYAFTHRALFRHALATGEHFVVTHPTVDVLAVGMAIALILSTTIARLQ